MIRSPSAQSAHDILLEGATAAGGAEVAQSAQGVLLRDVGTVAGREANSHPGHFWRYAAVDAAIVLLSILVPLMAYKILTRRRHVFDERGLALVEETVHSAMESFADVHEEAELAIANCLRGLREYHIKAASGQSSGLAAFRWQLRISILEAKKAVCLKLDKIEEVRRAFLEAAFSVSRPDPDKEMTIEEAAKVVRLNKLFTQIVHVYELATKVVEGEEELLQALANHYDDHTESASTFPEAAAHVKGAIAELGFSFRSLQPIIKSLGVSQWLAPVESVARDSLVSAEPQLFAESALPS